MTTQNTPSERERFEDEMVEAGFQRPARGPYGGYMYVEDSKAWAGWQAAKADAAGPIDMVLHCPACGMQHIDARETLNAGPDERGRRAPTAIVWDNPPHRSHLCHECGHIWRPADVPTNGVADTKTHGRGDQYPDMPLSERMKNLRRHGEGWRARAEAAEQKLRDAAGQQEPVAYRIDWPANANFNGFGQRFFGAGEGDRMRSQLAAAKNVGIEATPVPLYAAPMGTVVPDGWQLVPRTPTTEMKIAGDTAGRWCADKYRAMLAAAPMPNGLTRAETEATASVTGLPPLPCIACGLPDTKEHECVIPPSVGNSTPTPELPPHPHGPVGWSPMEAEAIRAYAAPIAAERDRLQAELLQTKKRLADMATENGGLIRERDRLREEVGLAQEQAANTEIGMAECAEENAALRTLSTELAGALERIRDGEFEGAADLGIRSEWHEFVNELQAIARAALAKMKP